MNAPDELMKDAFFDDTPLEQKSKSKSSSKKKHKNKHKSKPSSSSSGFEVSSSSLMHDDSSSRKQRHQSAPQPSPLGVSPLSTEGDRLASPNKCRRASTASMEATSPAQPSSRPRQTRPEAGRQPSTRTHQPAPLGPPSPISCHHSERNRPGVSPRRQHQSSQRKRPPNGLTASTGSQVISNVRTSSSDGAFETIDHDYGSNQGPIPPSDEEHGISAVMRVEPSSKGEIIFQNDEERQQSGYGVEIAPVTSVCSSRRDSKAHVYPSVWLRLPNTSFGISMGLAGQAIMWNSASNASFIRDHIDTAIISTIVWLLALLVGVVLFMAYCTKLYFYFPLCKDEYKDPSRIHFFNMPHLITIMLTISVPTEVPNMMTGVKEGQRIIWLISFIIQVCFTQHVYESWLFSEKHNINCARPQFLLSTVGWMLLAVLGAQVDIEGTWGLPLPTWCLGFGLMLYLMVAISVLNAIHHSPKAKGAPAHFLLIAPPATAVVATDLLDLNLAKFSFMGELLLGFCLGIFVLLVSIGPKIWQLPPVLGAYWAYVFPLSALAGAMIRYAWVVDTLAAQVAAIIFLIIAVLATCIVCARMMYHSYRVFAGYAEWDDPLLSRERLVSVKAMSYSELIHDFEETA